MNRFVRTLTAATYLGPPASADAKKEILSKLFPNRIDREHGLFHGRTSILLQDNQLCYLDMVGPPLKKMFSFDIIGHSLGATMLLGKDEWDRNKGAKKLLIHPFLSVENGAPSWPTKRAIAYGRTRNVWILVQEGTEREKLAWNLKINHAITSRSGGHYPSLEDLIESIMELSGLKMGVKSGAPPVNP